MRKGLIVLLSLGVVVGFGSGFARLAHRGSCHGGGGYERWGYGDTRGSEGFERSTPAPVAAPAPVQQQAPVYIVVPAAPSAAPIIINAAPGVPAAPANVVVIPAQPLPPAPVAPAAIPQPAPAAQ
jgi:hypothetical protein